MTLAEKIRSLQLANHILAVVGIVYVIVTKEYHLLYGAIITMYLMQVLGVNIGFHRYLTHRSFSTYNIVDKVLLFFGTISLVGTPLSWSISHINHHAYTDIEGDPYSPHRIKSWDYLMTRFEPIKHSRLGMRQMTQNKSCMFFHNHYLTVIGVYCILLFLINPLYVIYYWSIPSLLVLYLTLVTNIMCHTKGYRNYDTKDCSTNNTLISVLTMGEGYHNNHHNDPSNYNNRVRWFELDITALVIRMIKNG